MKRVLVLVGKNEMCMKFCLSIMHILTNTSIDILKNKSKKLYTNIYSLLLLTRNDKEENPCDSHYCVVSNNATPVQYCHK
jgi:hypothetical protein